MRIRQILINLISNAIKFTSQGEICLDVSIKQHVIEKHEKEKNKGEFLDKQWINFSVTDTGIGISPSKKKEIFNAFIQAENSISRIYGGTGLGLTIAKSLVHLQGGHLGLETRLAEGSHFWFTLPLEVINGAVPDHQIDKTELQSSEMCSKLHILIAEDNPINQVLTSYILESFGFRFTVVENGELAIEAVKKDHYDLILMDCHMPLMDGLSCTRIIREQNLIDPSIPIIALSADVIKGIKERCKQAGMNDFLSKPFKQKLLVEMLNKWLMSSLTIHTSRQEIPIEQSIPIKEIPHIDDSVLKELIDSGKNDLVIKLLQMYLDSSPKLIDQLTSAYESQSWDDLKFHAHSFKSSSANLGANILAGLCGELELMEHRAYKISAQPIVKKIKQEFILVLNIFTQQLETFKQPNLALQSHSSQANRVEDQVENKAVLLVDDDPLFQSMLEMVLTEQGYKVLHAENGQQCFEQLAENSIDIILLGYVVDDMNGLDICQCLRDNRQNDFIPILMVTGLEDADSIESGISSNANGIVVKPINFPILLQMLRFHLHTAENNKSLHSLRQQLSHIQNMTQIGSWVWGSKNQYFEVSNFLVTMLQIKQPLDQFGLMQYLSLVHPNDREQVNRTINAMLTGKMQESINYRMAINFLGKHHKETEYLMVKQELTLNSFDDDIVVGTIQEQTQKVIAEKDIHQLAFFDPLTKLSSRAYFKKQLEEMINDAGRRQESLALLYIELDDFQGIKETLGYHAGDELLVTIAARIQHVLRNNDCVSRLGEDEFAIISSMVHDELSAAIIAERLLETVNQIISLDTYQFKPKVSIGIACYASDGKTAETLLKAATSALYDAKCQGKHCYAFYRPQLTQKAESYFQIERDLRHSIRKNELRIHYQPQINLTTNKIETLEALVRWQHPEKGLITPDDFISTAERIGFIVDVDIWVLKTACQQAADWVKMGYKPFRLAVNLSAMHFNDKAIINSISDIITTSQWPAENLELEIPESVALSAQQEGYILKELHQLGVKVVINGFGVGASTLKSLKELPINSLKIDKILIQDILKNNQSLTLVDNIISLGNALGYSIIAVGVESDEQLQMLQKLNTYLIQGDYFTSPLPVDKMPKIFETSLNNGFILSPLQPL